MKTKRFSFIFTLLQSNKNHFNFIEGFRVFSCKDTYCWVSLGLKHSLLRPFFTCSFCCFVFCLFHYLCCLRLSRSSGHVSNRFQLRFGRSCFWLFFLSVSVSVLFGVFCSCIVVAVIVVAAAVVSAGLVA